jgi:hypothetical protein
MVIGPVGIVAPEVLVAPTGESRLEFVEVTEETVGIGKVVLNPPMGDRVVLWVGAIGLTSTEEVLDTAVVRPPVPVSLVDWP